MTLQAWLLYLTTVLVFMTTPGPSHLLMLSTSLSEGFSRSMATAAGDLTANVIQMSLAGFGLAALVVSAGNWFEWIKWAGIAYLVWIGVRQVAATWRRPATAQPAQQASLPSLWLRGFLTSAGNPKAVVFFAALFPQFIDPAHAVGPQVSLLGLTYLIVDGSFLAAYGGAASWLSPRLGGVGRNWLDRIGGVLMIATAIFIGLRSRGDAL